MAKCQRISRKTRVPTRVVVRRYDEMKAVQTVRCVHICLPFALTHESYDVSIALNGERARDGSMRVSNIQEKLRNGER